MHKETSYGNGFFSVIKATGFGLAFSLLSAIIFAVVLRTSSVNEKIIYPVNQMIKALSIVIGALAFVRGEKGWLKGVSVGLLFTALSYLAFSAIGGDFSLSWLIFLELFLASLVGAISGSLAVNLRK